MIRRAITAGKQQVEQDRPERGRADASQRERPELEREIAGAQHQRDPAATIRLRLREKSTLLSTQILAPATAMRPKTTIETPPSTGPGMVWISAPNFGLKPSRIAMRAATTKTSVEYTW